MLLIILESTLRSTLLGLSIWAALKLMRLRDAGTETLIWAGVLAAGFAMPFLTPLQAEGPTLHLPAPHMVQSPAVLSIGIEMQPGGAAESLFGFLAAASSWFSAHGLLLAWMLYAAVAAWNLARLTTGLALSWRLYRDATPVMEDWTGGYRIRTSTKVESPFSLGFAILLPTDHGEWALPARDAILAHEISHIRRGDFFIQLLARLYRSLFWFNPMAWWLTARLGELAETASDEAAIRALSDRTSYAEILIEASLRAHPEGALTAMAKGPDIRKRIDHILSDTPLETGAGMVTKLAAAGVLAALSFTFAAARAEINPAAPHRLPVMAVLHTLALPAASLQFAASGSARDARRGRAPVRQAAKPAHPGPLSATSDTPTYNPRALLDEPDALVLPTVIPVMDGANRQKPSQASHLSAVSDGNVTYLAQPQ